MIWLVVLAVGAGSFVFRVAPFLLLVRAPLGPRAESAIRHAGLAAITALIVVGTRQAATGGVALPALAAVAVGAVAAARRASILRLLLYGGGTYAGAVLVAGLLAR
jgi:branched-subunit amino acid transport protein